MFSVMYVHLKNKHKPHTNIEHLKVFESLIKNISILMNFNKKPKHGCKSWNIFLFLIKNVQIKNQFRF